MDVKVQNELAIQRFVEYVQIKTVQPEPDYDGAFEYLQRYAQELNLEYSRIQTDDDRYAAVLTVPTLVARIEASTSFLVANVVDGSIHSAQFPYRCRSGVRRVLDRSAVLGRNSRWKDLRTRHARYEMVTRLECDG